MINEFMNCASPAFFLGANTPDGFCSLFSELYGTDQCRRLFVLIGGPGTGKSSLMKKTAAEAEARGLYCERIHCSSDPDSLDAVIIPRLGTAMADGTSPHVIEPRFPGVFEKTVDLGEFRNDRLLSSNRDEIISKTQENSLEHKKCVGFLSAAAAAAADNRMLISAAADMRKLRNFSLRLAESVIPSESSSKGKVSRRLLSAVTPEGEKCFTDTFDAVCEKKIILDDEYGVFAPAVIRLISIEAVKSGFSVIECPCAMRSLKVSEHLMIPELSVGFFTSNRFHPYEGNRFRTVHCRRFCGDSVFREHKNRISFNTKAQNEFFDEAVIKIKNAKKLHDELEKYYIGAMDFGALGKKYKTLKAEIFGE